MHNSNESALCITIVNEDGTDLSDFPKNPLQEKWDRLYPPSINISASQVCDGYSCMWCGRCPKGSYWEVPEEDLEIWEQYQQEIKKYNQIHNPNLASMVEEYVKIAIKEET